MKFKADVNASRLVATEISGFDLFEYIFSGIIAAIIGGIALWDKWMSRNSNVSNDDKIEAFKQNVKKEDLIKLKNNLPKLDEAIAAKILDSKISFTPQMAQADIQLNMALQKEYSTTVAQLRKKALSLKPEDIGGTGKGLDALEAEYQKLYGFNATVDPKMYGLDKNAKFYYWDVNKKYDSLLKILFTSVGTKKMKDLGWNKSNLGLIIDHMIHFLYDNTDWYDNVYTKQNDDFYASVWKQLKGALPQCDWYNEWLGRDGYTDDPNDPKNQMKAMDEVEDDDGACAYAYGQDLGWFLEMPFHSCIISGHKLPSSNTAINICKELKSIVDINK